jgi:hypothetical protein
MNSYQKDRAALVGFAASVGAVMDTLPPKDWAKFSDALTNPPKGEKPRPATGPSGATCWWLIAAALGIGYAVRRQQEK